MIYNLCEYLKNNLAGEIIYNNTRHIISPAKKIPARNILIRETGGTVTSWFGFLRQLFQVITRDETNIKARRLAFDVYELIVDRYGIDLPEVIVAGETFEELETYQITCNSCPQSIGVDEHGYYEFSTNYLIIYRKEVR